MDPVCTDYIALKKTIQLFQYYANYLNVYNKIPAVYWSHRIFILKLCTLKSELTIFIDQYLLF